MSWVAIGDGKRPLRAPAPAARNRLLPVGSLVIELHPESDRTGTQTLVHLDRETGWRHRLTITLSPGGEVVVEHRQGGSATFAILTEPRILPQETLRLTYAWNAPARCGWLTAENATTGALVHSRFDDPHPLPMADAAALTSGTGDAARVHPSVAFLAVSDRVEPVGPMPGYLAGTWVDTATGPRPIETIAAGDLVTCGSGGLKPVRHAVSREVPALGQFRPVRLRAPFLGLRTDLCTAPHHRVLVESSDTEYLFGTESALIEARHLGPMSGPAQRRAGTTVRYHQLVLDRHDCLLTGGAWSESLNIGDLARRPARLAQSVLAGISPRNLPVHADSAGPLLKPYEAMVLVSSLCA